MTSRDRGGNESGAILIIVMVVMAVAVIALTAAVQAWSTTWRRDNEEELIFRANQYVDAIIAYRKEHGGQFPLNLEDLHKPGPRRFRYIRRLYKEPIAKDHKWGLLYLMPGGQGVYDPKAAQKAQEKAAKDWGSEWQTAGGGPLAQAPGQMAGQMPGVTPIGQNALGSGVPGTGGMPAGSLPGSAMPIQGNLPPIPTEDPSAQKVAGQEERVSEPPIGWPVVGVISRATGKLAQDTYRIYKGHEHVDEWQFHVFDRGETVQPPGTPMPGGGGPGFVGPGFGNHGLIQGVGGGPKPGRGMGPGGRMIWPPNQP
ncbi:MAG TPA: hypothetical protein VEO94_07525 [Candidatus Dormibacteraeota bacterium]|nr:hypothetical protein [Candidatus Dormibacteraeota bacterium]